MFSVFEDLLREANTLDALIERDKGTAPLLVRYLPYEDVHDGEYDKVLDHIHGIEERLSTFSFTPMRKMFLEDIISALKMQCREGMGEQIPFSERVTTYVGVPGESVSDEEMNSWKQDAHHLLQAKGYDGETDEMLKRWKEDNAVPSEDFPDSAGSLMQKALVETRERVMDLPAGTSVHFEPITDVFYGGYSKATGPFTSSVTLNADLRWHWPQLKNTVAHESFPGHSALNAIRAHQALSGVLPPEACFYFANTPITPIIEGTCNLGVKFLSWDEGPDFAIAHAVGMYEQARTNQWLFAYHQDGCTKDEVLARMMDEANMTEIEATTRFRFLSDPLWCTSMPHYYHGTKVTAEAWCKFSNEGAIDHLKRILFEEIHTFRTFQHRTGVTC